MPSKADRLARGEALMIELIGRVVLFNRGVAGRLGLSPGDEQYLSLLSAGGPMTAGELAKATGLTTGTVTGLVDRLEAKGLVVRDRDATDRRKVVVRADADEINRRVAPMYAGQGENLRAVLSRRTTAELDVILAFLADVAVDSPEHLPDDPPETG